MEYVISVSKTYSNSAKKRNSKTKKRSWRYYFYDEAGHLRRKTISRTQAYFMKLFVKKYKVRECPSCSQKYIGSCQNC